MAVCVAAPLIPVCLAPPSPQERAERPVTSDLLEPATEPGEEGEPGSCYTQRPLPQ